MFGRESWREHCLKHCLTRPMRPTEAFFEACSELGREP